MSWFAKVRSALATGCYTMLVGLVAGIIVGVFLQSVIAAVTGRIPYKVLWIAGAAGGGLGLIWGATAAVAGARTADVLVPRVDVERDPLQQMGSVAGAVAAAMLGGYHGYVNTPVETGKQVAALLLWGAGAGGLGAVIGGSLGVVFGALWGTIRESAGLIDPAEPAYPAAPDGKGKPPA
jgi:hypothetical protein